MDLPTRLHKSKALFIFRFQKWLIYHSYNWTAHKQFPGAPVEQAVTENRTVNLPFCFQNQANEEGLNTVGVSKSIKKTMGNK